MVFKATKISRGELRDGDHVVVNRSNLFTHHGIYLRVVVCGRVVDRVFHQTNGGYEKYGCRECHVDELKRGHAIIMTCLSCFLRGGRETEGSLRRFDYDVNLVEMVIRNGGSCSTRKSDSVKVVKDRVVRLFNSERGIGDYNFLFNNCEAFAIYAKTEIYMERSPQLMRGGASGMIGGAGCFTRSLCYMGYVELLGGFAVIPIGAHVLAHRFRVYRADKGFCILFRPKRISVEDLLNRGRNYSDDRIASTLGTIAKAVVHLFR